MTQSPRIPLPPLSLCVCVCVCVCVCCSAADSSIHPVEHYYGEVGDLDSTTVVPKPLGRRQTVERGQGPLQVEMAAGGLERMGVGVGVGVGGRMDTVPEDVPMSGWQG